jgi:hypothetical protein
MTVFFSVSILLSESHHFHENIVFAGPTALAVAESPTVRGKEALRAYWIASLARSNSLRFTVDHVLWDPVCRELAIIYTADTDGRIARVSENLTFNGDGLVVIAEVFHGVPGRT